MFVEIGDEMLSWSTGRLDIELRDIELAHRALAARRAACLHACEARQVPDDDGHRSLKAYVRATTNQPGAVAAIQVRRARFCRRFQAAGEALLGGQIGVAQVDVLARLAGHPRAGHLVDSDLVAMFLEHAEHFSSREFAALVDRWLMLADPDGPVPDDVEQRNATVHGVDGRLSVTVTGGDPLTTDRIRLIFDRFCEAEYRRDLELRRQVHGPTADHVPLARTNQQRRFDAFVAMCDTANEHADAPGRPVDVCVNVLIDQATLHDAFAQAGVTLPNGDVFNPADLDTLTARQRDALLVELCDPQRMLDRRCETASGQPVHPTLVARALLGGWIRTVIVNARREIVEVSSARRLFSGPWAVAAHLARPTCEHPGCELPGHLCDIDHRVPYPRGGPTAQYNSAIECNTHNRLKHTRGWQTLRALNRRLITVRPDGTLMLPVGERRPALQPDAA